VAEWGQVCSGKVEDGSEFASSGTYRYLGMDSVLVGGTSIAAFHYSESRKIVASSGSAPNGTQTGEWWIAANGLPLRVRRAVETERDFGFGAIETFRQSAKTKPDAGSDAGGQTMNDCILDALEPTPFPVADAGADG
jgi:hypothetical protein